MSNQRRQIKQKLGFGEFHHADYSMAEMPTHNNKNNIIKNIHYQMKKF